MNNFYTEPHLARQLYSIIGKHGSVPEQVNYDYVYALVTVYITNGNGEVWEANEIYENLISQFNIKQSYIAMTSLQKDYVRSKLQFSRCKKKYLDMLDIITVNMVMKGDNSLIEDIKEEVNKTTGAGISTRLKEKILLMDKNMIK